MLELVGATVGYGEALVLRDVSFHVDRGEILCLAGRNGAGKTTVMKTIMGLLRPQAGEIKLDGRVISAFAAHDVPRAGIGYIPQGRRLFSELTVRENLEVGLMVKRSGLDVLDRVLDLFPRLRERLDQQAQTLSGGEQQMLATARALCIEPAFLLLDEPTEGLQPSMIALIRDVVLRLKAEGVGILLVEQRLDAILQLADRVMTLENGEIKRSLGAEDLKANPQALKQDLGV